MILSRSIPAFAALFLSISATAADLKFVGALGNSGGDGAASVTFSGEVASGIGPVLGDDGSIWERGGSKQLNRYARDGRLLASFELPGSTEKSDQMIRVGDSLVFKIGRSLYSMPIDAEEGGKPARLEGAKEVEVLSVNSMDGRVMIKERGNDEIILFDIKDGTRTPILKPEHRVTAMYFGEDETLYLFGGSEVYAWKNGELVSGFPMGFNGERPVKIGDYWYSFSWHGTINRMNSEFEPDPGVVLGGASGSFIGYLPQSADLTLGRGMAKLDEGLFVASGAKGVVQFLKWNDRELRFDVVRRLGALTELNRLAIDRAGNIWTPRGAWQWDDSSAAPATIGDMEGSVYAQPVVLNGKTLCVMKKHYSYVQLASGPLIDSHGWSHLNTRNMENFELSETVVGGALVKDKEGGLSLIIAEVSGQAYQIGLTEDGQLRYHPKPVELPGLSNCTSLAAVSGKLLAANGNEVIVYEPTESGGWASTSPATGFAGDVFIHSDGARLAISDSAAGRVTLFDGIDKEIGTYGGLDNPQNVAVSGNRVVVIEAGKQRLVKLEVKAAPEKAGNEISVKEVPASLEAKTVKHGEIHFQNLGRPGGIPFEVAVTDYAQALTVSVRTANDPAVKVELGIANAKAAYVLTDEDGKRDGGQFDFLLPKGDWSTVRLAAAVTLPDQQERFGFLDHRAIHAPFSSDPAQWAVFDLESYRESVNSRRQEIRITFEQPVSGKATIVIDDESGERVRNLVSGRTFTKGNHTVLWDGLDENGKLITPGNFKWRGLTHAGIDPVYRMNFVNGGEDTVASWGPNHSTFHHAATNGELVFFAAPVTEGGWALVALDGDGNFVQGYDHQHGFGIQHDAVAADEKYLYCAQDGFAWGGTKGIDYKKDDWKSTWTITVVRYDIESGKMVEFPGKKRALEVSMIEVGPGSDHPDLEDYNLAGLAVRDGKLYVGARGEGKVFVLDAGTGAELETVELPGVRHLTASEKDGGGGAVFAATDSAVVELGAPTKAIIEAGKLDITGLTIAPVSGDILVSDSVSHQIHRFSAEGKPLGLIGKPGGPYKGAYDPARMVSPQGLVFGPSGKLWVTEDRWNPKRVLAWNLAANEVVYEKFGMPHYGGDGSGFDPENPNRWIGLGCFWDVDIETGAARPTHILSMDEGHFGNYEPHSYEFFRENGRTFLSARGKIALISEVLPDGTLHDLVATADIALFSYGCDWEPPQEYIDAFYERWPEKRSEEETGRRKGEGKPWAKRGTAVLWVDRNGDGSAQKDEFDFHADIDEYGGGAWGHMQNSLTLYMPVVVDKQVKVVAIKPGGVDSRCVPDYPALKDAIADALPVDLTPGYKRSGVPTIRDQMGRFIFNSDPEMNAYAADGTHLWSFPNEWSNVHGSHKAPLPEPGVMQGTLGILGRASFDEKADIFFMNGNHGRCFMLTTDGLYIDEAFTDVRVSYLKNEYRLGGEIFGGSFGRSEKDGKYYVQIGHGPYRIYELDGMGEMTRMEGDLTVTKEQISAAERNNLRLTADTQETRDFSVPGTVRWDKSGKFRTEVEVTTDDSHLHLQFRVEDSSPWVNNGRDWTKLFATGDTVDLQIGTNPAADPKRRDPVEGDKRLLISQFEGNPVAVLYEHRKPGGTNPIEFTSPWRGAKVDDVTKLADVEIDVTTDKGSYTVKAAIPLSALGLNIDTAATYQADFGVTFGDAEGSDTNLRSYWSNQSTGLVDDIPGEIMLSPALWGELRFSK